MSDNPGRRLAESLERCFAHRALFGSKGKIHQIPMRNIKGRLHDFEEVYPDEGEMNFFRIMRVLRNTQFQGSICPDHKSQHLDPGGLQAFAFGDRKSTRLNSSHEWISR